MDDGNQHRHLANEMEPPHASGGAAEVMPRNTIASISGDLNCDHQETPRGVSGLTLKL